MKVYSKALFVLFLIGLCIGSAAFLSRPVDSEVVITESRKVPDNEVIAGYKHWKQVNPAPQEVLSRISIQCAAPTAAQVDNEKNNPHRNKFVVVYVNDAGRTEMMERKFPVFPVGTVIVKEKLSTKESTSPELLTVMRKREPGYDPTKGDWEYMVFDGPGQTLQANGKLEKCQACHLGEKATDYVSRAYLPYEIFEKLK